MITEKIKKAFLVGAASLGLLVVGTLPAAAEYNASTTESLITTSVETIGDGIYTSASSILTAILPYAVGLICIFIAVAMAIRWMRRSVG